MHAAASRPAGRPETQTQAAANHCGPQVTEHQVYIVVASAVCVCLSLSHTHTVTHTHTTSTCSAAAMPTADVRRRSLSSTTRHRTYSRGGAQSLWRLAHHRRPPPALSTSLHCTYDAKPHSIFSLLTSHRGAYMHVTSARPIEEDKNACMHTCFERAKTTNGMHTPVRETRMTYPQFHTRALQQQQQPTLQRTYVRTRTVFLVIYTCMRKVRASVHADSDFVVGIDGAACVHCTHGTALQTRRHARW